MRCSLFWINHNNLYYSTDGRPGFGGFDIFVSHFDGKSWGKPVNLSEIINTADDDIAFNIGNDADTIGFYTIRNTNEKKTMQLFMVKLDKPKTLPELTGLSDVIYNTAMVNKELTAEHVEKVWKQPPLAALEPAPAKKVSTAKTDSVKQQNVKADSVQTKSADKTKVAEKEVPKEQTKAMAVSKTPETISKATEEKTKTVTTKPVTVAKTPETASKATQEKTKVVTTKPESKPEKKPEPKSEPAKEKVVYRVQFAASMKAKSSYTITVDGKNYKTWQYLYKGAYRQCVGDFSILEPAKNLQNACRRNGYPQAFVVVFVDGKRTIDPKYFR